VLHLIQEVAVVTAIAVVDQEVHHQEEDKFEVLRKKIKMLILKIEYMKKIIIALAVILNCGILAAQTEFDAFKMVQTDINGTARYMSMGGAFGALGGDASAIKDNPAGLGIYRSSELTGTLNGFMQSSSSKWYGASSLSDSYKLGFNNFSYVLSTPTWRNDKNVDGLLRSNFSFSYNRLKDYNQSLNIQGGNSPSSMTDYMAYFTGGISPTDLTYVAGSYEPFDNTNIPWISVLAYDGYLINPGTGTNNWNSALDSGQTVVPSYRLFQKGYKDEYSVGWAGNFSNVFFVGATLNLQTINYSAISQYSENFGSNQGMALSDTIYSNGTGLNLNLGAIYCPTDFMRVGLSLHTPTVFAMNDSYYSNLTYNTTQSGSLSTPGGVNSFQIQSPLIVNASVAFIVGQRGLVSAEYDYTNYTGTRLMSDSGNSQSFDLENQGMSSMLSNVGTIKIGGEYRLTDNFSLRAGYANSSNGTNPNAAKLIRPNTIRTDLEYFLENSTNYLSLGFGYHEAGWFLDFAYLNKIQDQTFYPYNTNAIAETQPGLVVSGAKVLTSNSNIAVTLGFKF
jgi:hypothetical protein